MARLFVVLGNEAGGGRIENLRFWWNGINRENEFVE
jgi:hypothetical protein